MIVEILLSKPPPPKKKLARQVSFELNIHPMKLILGTQHVFTAKETKRLIIKQKHLISTFEKKRKRSGCYLGKRSK